MKHLYMPLVMGFVMGLMMPWMAHAAPEAGWLFVLAHVVVIAGLLSLGLIWLRARAVVRSHFTRPMVGRMALGTASGAALTIAFHIAAGGPHWTL
ncbi:MAG: hypothetical protein AAFQ36_11825 [Pseudomonadota bacterium]